jgi:hypothetical protein
MITIIGNGDPMPTKSVRPPWAKAGVINIEKTPRISLLRLARRETALVSG